MAKLGKRTLTPSAVEKFIECSKAYDFSYNDRIYPISYSSALTTGSAVHAGVEHLKNTGNLEQAIQAAIMVIGERMLEPDCGLSEEALEKANAQAGRDCSKARAMLKGYYERWHRGYPHRDDELDFRKTEMLLEKALKNPRTTGESRTFKLAGKVDGLAAKKNEDHTKLYIFELKTTSDTLDELENSLKQSIQPSVYMDMAQAELQKNGSEIMGAVFDIIKKPTIRGRKGESAENFEQRCTEEYIKDPDKFFRRIYFPLDEQKLKETASIFWRTAQAIRDCDRYGYWAAKGQKCRKTYGWCEYRALCWHGDREGYRLGDVAHEELGIEI